MVENAAIIVVLYVIFFILLIIYILVVHHQYQKKTGLFKPYEQPPLPNGFQPNGSTYTPLTPEEIQQRQSIFGNGSTGS